MSSIERPDDFAKRRERLKTLTDEELHTRFWSLVDKIVEPLVEEARTHTTPSIERSVLLRMGFSSIEASVIVAQMSERDFLSHGAGHLVLELARRKNISVHDAGSALIAEQYWEELLV